MDTLPCTPPANEYRKIDAPIVVLADIHSISMSEMTAMAVLSLPNGYIAGERTWGGTGPLFGDYDFSYGGSFENHAFSVYTSTSLMRDIHGNILEGKGVTPDIEALYDETAMKNGTDSQLEKALAFIESRNK